MAAKVATEALPARIRHRFPILERLVYVNSCSQGALSDSVRAAYEAYLHDWDEKGAPWEYWVERAETVRAAFAGLVGADADEVAVTTSLSAGVSALMSGLRFEEGRYLAAAPNARLIHVPGATHMVSLTRPAAFTRMLLDAIAEVA